MRIFVRACHLGRVLKVIKRNWNDVVDENCSVDDITSSTV